MEAKTNDNNPNLIYVSIQNYIMSINKILLIMTPSNNFWFKSEKIWGALKPAPETVMCSRAIVTTAGPMIVSVSQTMSARA